jgi:UDP-2,3-diacylglucosamine hydrolase
MNPVYFASDFHLGVDAHSRSRDREQTIVRWLDFAAKEGAGEIFLVGDLFDFWFEYRSVVPRGFVRLLGKIAEICDSGIPVRVFTGNHDMWMFGYLEEELGVTIYRKPVTRTFGDQTFFIGHGDGLGPGDRGYKLLKVVFSNPLCQWLFARLHPGFSFSIAQYWSGKSRLANPETGTFLGPQNEWLLQFAESHIKNHDVDFFVFGHRHLPIDYLLSNQHSRYINLGEWLNYNSYAVFDGNSLTIKFFESDNPYLYSNHLPDLPSTTR